MRRPTLTALLVLLALPPVRSAGGDAPPAGMPPMLPRSSIGAVLAQRGALDLTADQVKGLEQVDARLAREQEAARQAAARAADGAGGSPEAPQRPSSGSPAGGGPAGGGPGMAGGKTRPPPNVKTRGPDPVEALRQQLDALDTQALLEAVETLPEAKREKAIEVASRYREQLFEQREREKGK